jgi:hypothetical protein
MIPHSQSIVAVQTARQVDVCFGSLADISTRTADICFASKSGVTERRRHVR